MSELKNIEFYIANHGQMIYGVRKVDLINKDMKAEWLGFSKYSDGTYEFCGGLCEWIDNDTRDNFDKCTFIGSFENTDKDIDPKIILLKINEHIPQGLVLREGKKTFIVQDKPTINQCYRRVQIVNVFAVPMKVETIDIPVFKLFNHYVLGMIETHSGLFDYELDDVFMASMIVSDVKLKNKIKIK